MLPAFGLYTHIQANRRRSVLLLAGLFVLVHLLSFAVVLVMQGAGLTAEGEGTLASHLRTAWADTLVLAPWVTLGTLMWIGLSYFLHQSMLDAVTGARAIGRDDDPRLYNLAENLCISRGLPMPRLKLIETEALNAYASGLDEGQYAITVTRGLVDALDDSELEAVLAHELTHIRNEDVRMMVVAVVIAGVISFVGELVFRWLIRGPRLARSAGTDGSGRRGKGGGALLAILVGLALIAVAWALSLVLRFALSRSREYLADAGAVELTKNPDAMISALVKISGRGEIAGIPSGIMEMCIDNPRSGFVDLFASHPPVEDRIEALVRYAGGRRPAPPATVPAVPQGGPPADAPWGPVREVP